MSNLRNKLIRLAHAKPELRKDLLPLLTEKVVGKTAEWKVLSEREASSLASDLVDDVYAAIQNKFGVPEPVVIQFIDGDSRNLKIHKDFVEMVTSYILFEQYNEDRTK